MGQGAPRFCDLKDGPGDRFPGTASNIALDNEGEGPSVDRVGHEVMPIVSLAPNTDEKALGFHPPGIVLDRGDFLVQVSLEKDIRKPIN
jgi:hypothetical protein